MFRLFGNEISKAKLSINNEMDIKSRKYQIGYAKTVKSLRMGKAKAVIIAKNIPPIQKSTIEYWARLFQTPVYHYRGSDWQLGMACGKHFRVRTLSITDLSNANIIHLSGEHFNISTQTLQNGQAGKIHYLED